MTIPIVHKTPANPHAAAQNRRAFDRHGLICLNLVGSVGTGKTCLLEAVLPRLHQELRVGVIAGALATTCDAERIGALGVPVVQVLTDGHCHLSAAQVQAGLRELPLADLDLVIVENLGSLTCQATADLGEHLRVAVLSVSGGAVATKYPHVFRTARLILVTKCDLLPHVQFDLQAALDQLRELNPSAEIICTDTHSRTGIARLAGWLLGYVRVQSRRALLRPAAAPAALLGLPV
ncbi:MAG: hydrogenase nickel incorporation protein HypB [Planctomycetota bacterium]